MKYAGELAAIATAVCWAIGSNLFTAAARRMGAVVLNRHRLLVATVLMAAILWVTHGAPWPFWASSSQVIILAISGLVGFAFGDTWFIRALVVLGPGRAGLMASLAPLLTAVLGWLVLGEHMGPLAWMGTLLTVGGVAWVMMDRRTHEHASRHGNIAAGVMAGLLASLGQSVGYVLSKMALRTGIDPLSANAIRLAAGAVAIWGLAAFRGQIRQTLEAIEDRGAMAFMLTGTVFGPVLGVGLSLVALQFIEVGVAGSLTAIYPILALAISARFHAEPLTARTLFGAVLAIAGVVVLFLR